MEHLKSSITISQDKHKYDNLIANTDKTLHKIEEEIQSVKDNEKEKWVLGESFTALDINLAVSLHRLHELGYGSLLGDKPGLQQFWNMIQLRPVYQELFLRSIHVMDVGQSIENVGSSVYEDTDKDLKRTTSLSSHESLDEVQNKENLGETTKNVDDEDIQTKHVHSGVFKITVHKAENLLDKDFAGKSDPYVLINYGGKLFKSKPLKNTLDPTFEFSAEFDTVKEGPSEIIVEVFDDDVGKDESLGHANIDIHQAGAQTDSNWVNLKGTKSGRILVSLNFTREAGQTTDRSIDEVSDVTSPEPTSGHDNEDGGKVKKQRKKQRKRQNEDRTWYSLW